MNCLVTGGTGFIGSHLVERLLSDNHNVVVLDNLCTGRKANIAHLLNSSKLVFVNVDIAEKLSVIKPLFTGIDWVFHLAARADIIPSIADPISYHHSNVTGTIHALKASSDAGVKRFIYTASASCYGMVTQIPTSETAPINLMYPYALTKYLGEQYALHWAKVFKLPVVSLRLFNVYGPRSRTSGTYGAVFGTFLAQKLAGASFTVVGDGNQTRDFIFATDVVDAYIKSAQSNVAGEFFNVGSGQRYSINQLVKLLGGKVIHLPKRPGEPDQTQADITKIKNKLDWKPKVSFEKGVGILLKNINYWQAAPVWTAKKIEKATREWFKYLT